MTQLYSWHLTASCEKVTQKKLHDWATTFCERGFYQKELSVSKYEHWQCHFHLKERKRKGELLKELNENFGKGWGHLSPATSMNKDKMEYVMKERTRIDGPWSINDDIKPLYDLIEIEKGLFPWQASIAEILKIQDPRSIHVCIDPVGANGKSTMVKWLRQKKKATVVPTFYDRKDLVQAVMCMQQAEAYVFDLPRGFDKKKIAGLWGGIEQVKSGYVYDPRHAFKDRIFPNPAIVVFTNEEPPIMLSEDRIVKWLICPKTKELIEFTKERYNAIMVYKSTIKGNENNYKSGDKRKPSMWDLQVCASAE